jgi:serine/threonine protein kinase
VHIFLTVSININCFHYNSNNFFQYGVSADVYSMTIILFELFSGIDPFPGRMFQIFQDKLSGKEPAVPTDFPSNLKELISLGLSKEPNKRPQIHRFKSALVKMLTEEKDIAMLRLENPVSKTTGKFFDPY